MIYKLFVEFHGDFVKLNKNKITIGIKSNPVKGEANKEIVKKLAKQFDVSSSSVKIRSGLKSRQKIIEILD